ncbi:hypothetical protein NDA18_002258 [Ustilago nuda]|nr:hypothetical protein NDA18_002258 [Ustilago nuda]
MDHTLLKRHKEAPGCVWKPGMVGPACRPPSALKKAAMAGKDSYYEMAKYSRITTWVLLSLLAVVVLRNLLAKLRHSSSNPRLSLLVLSIPGYKTVAAICRGVGYYRPKRIFARRTILSDVVSADRFPSLGNILAITLPTIGFTAWCFAIKPYYRPTAVWGSTPLGVRAGMIANAFFPWLFAFGLKFNPLTFLTGISHEKLQFYHQWTARVILFFSIVHTVPFLWQPVHDGGFSNLKAWYYYDKVWWTGTVALAFLAWLVVSSFGWFRRMSYEFFVFQHVLTIVLFLVFYFMHTRDMLTSWSWLWPSVGVWGFHVLMKFANSLRISRFTGVQGIVTVVDEDERLLRLEVSAPVSWQAGQHFFLRFPGFNRAAPYQTHPFTVANLPIPNDNLDSHLIFYFKARDGLTKSMWERLMRLPAIKGEISTTVKVALDGPYGSPFYPASYHSDLMLAGGVGMTSILPALMNLCIAARANSHDRITSRVAVHWAIHSLRVYDVFEGSLRPIIDHLRALGFDATLDVYCREHLPEVIEKDVKEGIRMHSDRASVPEIVSGFVEEEKEKRTIGVTVCGPAGMLSETANSVARLQWSHVLSGGNGVQELYLHTEAFDW